MAVPVLYPSTWIVTLFGNRKSVSIIDLSFVRTILQYFWNLDDSKGRMFERVFFCQNWRGQSNTVTIAYFLRCPALDARNATGIRTGGSTTATPMPSTTGDASAAQTDTLTSKYPPLSWSWWEKERGKSKPKCLSVLDRIYPIIFGQILAMRPKIHIHFWPNLMVIKLTSRCKLRIVWPF